MDEVSSERSNERNDAASKISKLQMQVSELDEEINKRQMALDNFREVHPEDKTFINSASGTLELYKLQRIAKKNLLKAEQDKIKKINKAEKADIKAEEKEVNGIEKANKTIENVDKGVKTGAKGARTAAQVAAAFGSKDTADKMGHLADKLDDVAEKTDKVAKIADTAAEASEKNAAAPSGAIVSPKDGEKTQIIEEVVKEEGEPPQASPPAKVEDPKVQIAVEGEKDGGAVNDKPKGFSLLFILLALIGAYVGFSGLMGNTFDVMPEPYDDVPLIFAIEAFFIVWFLVDSKCNNKNHDWVSFAILMVLFLINFFWAPITFVFELQHIPVMWILVLLKYSSSGTSISLKSLIWAGVLLLFIAFIFSLIPIASSLAESIGGSDSGSGSDIPTSDPTASTSDSKPFNFWCFIAPMLCENDQPLDANINLDLSNGTLIDFKPGLAQPSMVVNKKEIRPTRIVHSAWKAVNLGDKPIDTALFLINGSDIHGNQRGFIDLDTGFDAINYPGVTIPPEYFYKLYPNIPSKKDKTIRVSITAPACFLGNFEAPVFVLYKYDISSRLELTFASFDWWQDMVEQGKEVDYLMPRRSISTIGPFSLSISPDEDKQPVVLEPSEIFGLSFELADIHNGRGAISMFEVYISNKLIPQGLGTSCDLVALPPSSSPSPTLNAYTLKPALLAEISSADLSLNDGFSGPEEFYCPFKYDSTSFADDLGEGSSQRTIIAYAEYTYIYNGMFSLSTRNDTGYAECIVP